MATVVRSPGRLRAASHLASPRTSYRQDLVTVGVGLWLIVGVFVDGWAHTTRGATIESFFTPWHALLYSGYLACAAWIGWLIGRGRASGRGGADAVPVGYGLGTLGVVVFGLSGLGDLAWHTLFGIETGVKALLSPTHLGLFLGAVLILTSPLRATWADLDGAPSLRAFAPALVSSLSAIGFSYFMGQFVWAPLNTLYRDPSERSQLGGIVDILLTNLLLLGPVFLLMRRWRLPFGTVAILFGVTGALLQAMVGLPAPEQVLIALLVGLQADGILALLPSDRGDQAAFRMVGVAVPLAQWSLYFLAGQLRYGIAWAPELWTGALVLSMLMGLGLSLAVAPPHSGLEVR